MKNQLNFLSTRSGFNTALRYFKLVNKFIKKFDSKVNLADSINEALENKLTDQTQIAAILNALLVDKFGYVSKSFNMKKTFSGKMQDISDELSKWNMFDIVISYFHPQLGQIVINPKNQTSIENVDKFKENELVVAFVGNFKAEYDKTVAAEAAEAIKQIFNEEKPKNLKKFYGEAKVADKQAAEEKKPAATAAAAKPAAKTAVTTPKPEAKPAPVSNAKKKLSPQYGITVANELFHNGNVEAWKRIINSYETKYPDTKILVFYDGEEIKDINTLFKWGKVKHGTNIYVSLLGPEFRDVSKLRRYLSQGASHMFEAFLKGDPSKVLALF
ncbi:MAG: hypothetical protein IKQ61_10530 [Spirochaetales bacterium]|nr:hypothetical protein [Spirochaetales bacterium]MBR6200680.1 hypothetical protein [Spirochaetales bacterium]